MDIAKARKLVALLPPKLLNFFIKFPPRDPALRTIYSAKDNAIVIAKRLHDFKPVTREFHKPQTGTTYGTNGQPLSTVYMPYQNPFKISRDPRSGRVHGPRYSLRRQADIIKLAMRFGVAELLPPSAKMTKLMVGKKRPMMGTIRPKGTKEERTRKEYAATKEKNIEEALRVVQMRKTVLFLCDTAFLTSSGGQLERTDLLSQMHLGIERKDISDNIEPSSNRNILSIQISNWVVVDLSMLGSKVELLILI